MIPDELRDLLAVSLPRQIALSAVEYGLSAEEQRHLDAWVRQRLAENDFALLRAPPGELVFRYFFRAVGRLLEQYHVGRAKDAARVAARVAQQQKSDGLFVRVTCLDVTVGSATFLPAMGLTHTALEPTVDYFMISRFARAMGEWLKRRRYWSPMDGDVTDVIGDAWGGERLALADGLGRQLAVSHVIVVERRLSNRDEIRLVADFRPDHARVAAPLSATDLGSGGRTRPAA